MTKGTTAISAVLILSAALPLGAAADTHRSTWPGAHRVRHRTILSEHPAVTGTADNNHDYRFYSDGHGYLHAPWRGFRNLDFNQPPRKDYNLRSSDGDRTVPKWPDGADRFLEQP